MEDASLTKIVREDLAAFGVFDGHGTMPGFNHEIPALCVEEFCAQLHDGALPPAAEVLMHKTELENMFLQVDGGNVKSHWRSNNVGCTAILAAVSPALVCLANCGDSRAVVKIEGKDLVATKDHKPDVKQEKHRIEAAGGKVVAGYLCGIPSPGAPPNPELGVSRGLGDHRFKRNSSLAVQDQMISCMPDVTVVPRNNCEPCLVLLGCDGVWDVLTNEEAMVIVENAINAGMGVEAACRDVVRTALDKGSRDNVSALVVQLDAGAVSFVGGPSPLSARVSRHFVIVPTAAFSVIDPI
jgi:serine/threonine protein phosphatase PrpC